MNTLSLVSSLIAIIRILLVWAERKKWIDEGEARGALKGLEISNDRIQKALAARRAATASRVSDDDPYDRD